MMMMIKIMLEDDVSRCPLEETLRRCFREKVLKLSRKNVQKTCQN